ncbi:hypothetical protein BD410DRAFT_843519 [Rickenella mellea]|uniref:Uncharacterized protein n=1 Tax=Rickenella mellea TaxID=50990 RepID=A0A4Y7PRE6_9AGAM|nr:hypothetical protein BD410DRAFT_843519 [Rickenella mellea]
MPHFVELARQRFREAETAGQIAEMLHLEIALMYVMIFLLVTRSVSLFDRLIDSACAPRVTAMIVQVMQGNVDSVLQLLLHLPDLKKLVEEAEALGDRGQQDAMEVDPPFLRMGESTLVVPAIDSPVLTDNVHSNFADLATFDALREIVGFFRTNMGNGGGEADHRARRARGRDQYFEVGVAGFLCEPSGRVIHSLPLILILATLASLLKKL